MRSIVVGWASNQRWKGEAGVEKRRRGSKGVRGRRCEAVCGEVHFRARTFGGRYVFVRGRLSGVGV